MVGAAHQFLEVDFVWKRRASIPWMSKAVARRNMRAWTNPGDGGRWSRNARTRAAIARFCRNVVVDLQSGTIIKNRYGRSYPLKHDSSEGSNEATSTPALKGRTKPRALQPDTLRTMSEKIAKLGITRDNDLMYYIKAGDVWASPRKQAGKPKGKAKKIVDVGVKLDYSKYIYFLDAGGDIARKARNVGGKRAKK